MKKSPAPADLIRQAGGIIFDFDGTLYDSKYFALRLIAAGLPDIFKIRAERRARKALTGRDFGSAEPYFKEFFALQSRFCSRSPDYLRNWYFTRYMPLMIGVLGRFYPARPGSAEIFAALRRPVAVYSDYPFLRERIAAIGLNPDSCGKLYGPDSFGAQKPALRPFLAIAADLGCAPETITVVGDRDDTDGAGAAAAGMGYIKISAPQKPAKSGQASLSWDAFRSLIQACQPG